MKPSITVLTLCVDDLERAVGFYRDGLGFTTKGIIGKEFENGAVAFFNLESGLKLALWPRKSLAADTGLPMQAHNATAMAIGHNVSSDGETDIHAEHLDRQFNFASCFTWQATYALGDARISQKTQGIVAGGLARA